MRTSRSTAQASDVAVVSWPATSSVISSSRSSVSSIGEPSSWRARSSRERMSSRSSRSSAVRRSWISRMTAASTGASARRSIFRRSSRSGPSTAIATRRDGRVVQSSASPSTPRSSAARAGILDAEDRPDDHRQGHGLHPRPQLRGPGGPRADLGLGDLGDQLAVALHALAVEGRQQQLALGQVLLAVEQQHRLVAEHRPQHDVGLARAEQLGVGGEHRADVRGIGDEDPRALVGDPHGERRPEALAGAGHERAGPRHPGQGLDGPGPGRAGRKGGAHAVIGRVKWRTKSSRCLVCQHSNAMQWRS